MTSCRQAFVYRWSICRTTLLGVEGAELTACLAVQVLVGRFEPGAWDSFDPDKS